MSGAVARKPVSDWAGNYSSEENLGMAEYLQQLA